MKLYLSPVTKPGRWCHFWPSIFLLSANKAILCPLSCFLTFFSPRSLHIIPSSVSSTPPPTLGCQSWLSPSERQEDEVREEQEHLGEWFSVHLQKEKKWGKKVKFLFQYVIIALRASLSVLISVLQVCAVHVWSWKRAAVDGLKSGVWASHPVCICWKTLKSCPNYGKY